MRELTCDVAVIGAGTAGIAAYRAAAKAGAEAVLIERGPGGTTCARVGCMPSKLLIAAGAAAHEARGAGLFGVRVGSVTVDGKAVMARLRAERDRFVGGVFESLDGIEPDRRISGQARFRDHHTLAVDDHTLVRFRAAVIATGSSPNVPKPLQGLAERVLTTDTLFEVPDLPRSLAVLGGGPVGIELAQAMARLGVAVTLFDTGATLAGLSHPDLVRAAREIFAAELDLHMESEIASAEADGAGLRLAWTGPDGSRGEAAFERVLAATGRPPNLAGLDLERGGLHLGDKGMPDFDARRLLCAGAPVLIAGDAAALRPVLHEASRQGGIAGANAAAIARGAAPEAPEPWTNLAMVFTHPQTASVGASYDPDATDRIEGGADFCDQGRARIEGHNRGALRLWADRTGRLLGAEMIAPAAEHLGHILADAIGRGLTAAAMLDRPVYHPTVEEGLSGALSEIADSAAAD
ncbi:dihydrolipoyl dehydrogenase [Methylobacterium dankookense]|uniref:Dihydrolipoyl dehydrogenase n=1 Tax=Methylobacterium dankookense TaxID=560405 RepID=A0A564G007_9HYPH|nr:dihydrolipoyl dehydrogenase [Methylobacterium dankookense]GJD57095.1 Dihydrolipoyl dehydrogenase [Methylobacterium dankookense]VUF13547.1 Dihydrolipoyl dehydrogenase [Methylobacterium dankookense]